MDPLTRRVFHRYAFKYIPKEKKEHKVERLSRALREATGLSKGQAVDIADAVVRGREVERLAIQKNWPITDGIVEGPKGAMSLKDLRSQVGE